MRRLWRRLFGPRRSKYRAEFSQITLQGHGWIAPDWCCVCLEDLAADEVYEVREHLQNTPEMGREGGTWVVRTYCAEHAPPDALAPLPSGQ